MLSAKQFNTFCLLIDLKFIKEGGEKKRESEGREIERERERQRRERERDEDEERF